jgi:hypothetical protein
VGPPPPQECSCKEKKKKEIVCIVMTGVTSNVLFNFSTAELGTLAQQARAIHNRYHTDLKIDTKYVSLLSKEIREDEERAGKREYRQEQIRAERKKSLIDRTR